MYRVVVLETGQGFKAHDRQFQSMRALGAGGLHLRSCTGSVACREGMIIKTHKRPLDGAETNAGKMLLPASAGSKQPGR